MSSAMGRAGRYVIAPGAAVVVRANSAAKKPVLEGVDHVDAYAHETFGIKTPHKIQSPGDVHSSVDWFQPSIRCKQSEFFQSADTKNNNGS